MNEIIKAMEERRSIRRFKPEMPAKKDLEQIIEAGLYAANGMGKQAVITLAVTDKEVRDRLSFITKAAAVIGKHLTQSCKNTLLKSAQKERMANA